MKAIIQSYKTGEISLTEMPTPSLPTDGLLVQNLASLVSAGTEKSMVELAQKSLLGKARQRPDLVRQVLKKARTDGLMPTIQAVRSRLDTPIPLGYSSTGVVMVSQAAGFKPGDRVACAGAGVANHAEIIAVPKNLAVALPHHVDHEAAAFVTLGAIALQGIRLANLHLGEIGAVIGLGLLGQLTVQLLKAAGCVVIGMDIQRSRAELAQTLGADAVATSDTELAALVTRFSHGHGADAVLITAATKSNRPVEVAGEIARSNGTVVVVGLVPMELPRKPYYDKELTFRVSRSYGPGRYDPSYEQDGHDYPIGYVRWTENRNMAAFVQLLADGKLNLHPLITHRFPLDHGLSAYDLITSEEPYLGILLTYPDTVEPTPRVEFRQPTHTKAKLVRVGMLGAGAFATGTLLPILQNAKATQLVSVCAASGLSAHHAAQKFRFQEATTDEAAVISHPDVNTVVIATRHHLHAAQVLAAMQANKHIFCEKPLCLHPDELAAIEVAAGDYTGQLMVGFNRRFAPLAVEMKRFLSQIDEPLAMHYRVNAGYLPRDHWVHHEGGGRILGEVCHFVDFLTFLADALPIRVYARALPNGGRYQDDNVAVMLDFANGSVGTITYVANGDKAFPKEQVEVFGGGGVVVLDNFRRVEWVRHGKTHTIKPRLGQDKGHQAAWAAFVESIVHEGQAPIAFGQLAAVTRATFGVAAAVQTGTIIQL